MNIFSFILFFACLNFLYLGITAYWLNKSSNVNRLLLLLCLCFSLWALAYSFLHVSATREAAFFWYVASSIGWIFFIPVIIHLLLQLAKRDVATRMSIIIVMYSLTFIGLVGINVLMISPNILSRVPYGWTARYELSPWMLVLCMVIYVVLIGYGFIRLNIWANQTHFKREKKQVRIFLFTMLISLTLTAICDNLIPFLKMARFPLVGPVFFLIWLLGTWYSIKKYRMMVIDTSFAASEIINNMNDLLVLIDWEGIIRQASPRTLRTLGFAESEIYGKTFDALVVEQELIENEIKLFNASNISGSVFEVHYRTGTDELIPMRLSGSAVRDDEGDLLGIVYVGYDLRETRKLEEMQRMLQMELEMAAYVQSSLFPSVPPVTDEWDIYHVFKPVSAVSGDFYDYYESGGVLRGVAIFDVSGHGLSAGLITLMAKSIVYRVFTTMYDASLDLVLDAINNELVNEVGHADNFMTGIILRFKGNEVEYVNAGHTQLLYKAAGSGGVSTINAANDDFRGSVLCVSNLMPKFKSITFKSSPGDQILLYTDDLVESINAQKIHYGEERLIDAFIQAPNSIAQEAMEYILHDLENYTGGQAQKDDLTAILLRKK